MSEVEAAARLKYENSGYVSMDKPDTDTWVNMDMRRVYISRYVTQFGRAFKACNRPWLLQTDIEIKHSLSPIPDPLRGENGRAFLKSNLADTAWVYAVGQAMIPTERYDDSERYDEEHCDGGASLLHAGLTIWGRRILFVTLANGEKKLVVQEPGDFYVGNMCAALHQVKHLGHGEAGPLFGHRDDCGGDRAGYTRYARPHPWPCVLLSSLR